jgi:hypothetical protein
MQSSNFEKIMHKFRTCPGPFIVVLSICRFFWLFGSFPGGGSFEILPSCVGAIACNVRAYLKWLGAGCAIGEDVSEVGGYNPGANARSLP